MVLFGNKRTFEVPSFLQDTISSIQLHPSICSVHKKKIISTRAHSTKFARSFLFLFFFFHFFLKTRKDKVYLGRWPENGHLCFFTRVKIESVFLRYTLFLITILFFRPDFRLRIFL